MLLTPVRAPRANAYAERWVRTVRAGCLDWLLVVGRGHLAQLLRVYLEHYNAHRPHLALQLIMCGAVVHRRRESYGHRQRGAPG